MRTLLDENETVMLDEIWNIVGYIAENKLFLTFFILILMLKTKNCIFSQKTTTIEPIQTILV